MIYFDKYGHQIFAGDVVLLDGRKEKVYMTNEGELGRDATNPEWIDSGKAVPCEFGIYPFTRTELAEIEKVSE